MIKRINAGTTTEVPPGGAWQDVEIQGQVFQALATTPQPGGPGWYLSPYPVNTSISFGQRRFTSIKLADAALNTAGLRPGQPLAYSGRVELKFSRGGEPYLQALDFPESPNLVTPEPDFPSGPESKALTALSMLREHIANPNGIVPPSPVEDAVRFIKDNVSAAELVEERNRFFIVIDLKNHGVRPEIAQRLVGQALQAYDVEVLVRPRVAYDTPEATFKSLVGAAVVGDWAGMLRAYSPAHRAHLNEHVSAEDRPGMMSLMAGTLTGATLIGPVPIEPGRQELRVNGERWVFALNNGEWLVE